MGSSSLLVPWLPTQTSHRSRVPAALLFLHSRRGFAAAPIKRPSRWTAPLKRFLLVGAFVVAAGAANAWYHTSTKNVVATPSPDPKEEQGPAPLTVGDILSLPTNKDELKIDFYQYSYQPASCQVRSYLDMRKFKYNAIEVCPITKNPLPYPTTAQRKAKNIPLVHINGKEVSFAVHIVLFLEWYLSRNGQVRPETREEVARMCVPLPFLCLLCSSAPLRSVWLCGVQVLS